MDGRIAIVTGGSSGIGLACVELLEAAGARAVSWDISEGADVHCDVADPNSVELAIAETSRRYGPASVLVAAAGTGISASIMHLDADDWDRVFGTNVRGTMLSIQAVGRVIRDNVDKTLGGSIVAVSSINGQLADPGLSAYAASKAAVNQLVRVAARELGNLGIRVNAVGPGPTDTPLLGGLLASPGYLDEVVARSALGGIASPLLVAEAVIGVMSMEWVTGQVLLVDGGTSLNTGRSTDWAESAM